MKHGMRISAAVLVLWCSWVGVAQAAAPATPVSCIWFADKEAIYQVASDTNQVAKTIALDKAHNLAMNGSDCGVWAVAGKQLYQFDANGVLTQQIALRSLNDKLDDSTQAAVDPYDGSVWLSGNKMLVHVGADGQLIATGAAPGNIASLRVALDQSLWLLDNKQLWHYSPQGVLLSTQDLHKLLEPEPKYAAIDNLGEVLWLAGEKQLTQIRLDQTNQAAIQIALPDIANALAINPRTGEVWVTTEKMLLSYGWDGAPGHVIDLKALNLKNAGQFAFDPASQSLWVAADHAVGRFSAQGDFIASLEAKNADMALAVPAFVLTPTLSLIRPPSMTITNNPTPTISYGYGALCNNQPCGFAPDYFSGYLLAAELNQASIGPFTFNQVNGEASFTPAGKLPEGQNTLTAQATDEFGHTSNIASDIFTVDTIPPKFLSIAPAEGSVTNTPAVTIQGVVDDVTAGVWLSGVGNATNTTTSNGNLNFSFPVTLKEGLNTFDLLAWDKANNNSTAILHLTYSAVSIVVASPANGIAVNDDSILVTGSFQGPSNTGIAVNGVVATQNGNSFYAKVPLQAGANTLTITATTIAGGTFTQTLNVVSSGPAPIQVAASAMSGIAPLTVGFTVQNRTANAVAKIEVDFNGDGVSDFTTTNPAATLQYIYTTPGVYQANFKISGSQGVVVQKTVMIVVQDAAQIDQMLKAQWNGMNSALVIGDKAQAMSYLNSQAQEKYGPVFDALRLKMPGIVASYAPAQTVSITQEIGEYAINRMIGGVNRIFFIYFLRGDDGVWRLDSM